MSEAAKPAQDGVVDDAVAQGGAYEIIRKRLVAQGQSLKQIANTINERRLQEFGSSDMAVSARTRIRTVNNCVPRDIVQVGDYLLFGYNVFIGLKKETAVEDVFSLFKLGSNDSDTDLEQVSAEGTFLADRGFVNDFSELYRYYKHTKLIELSVKDGKLLAGFQIGERLDDLRVFRWSISADGKTVKYIDNRGERDISLPPAFDFTWIETTREHSVHGKHPHVNIEDTVFVETVGGDLTIKVENNTEDGLGIYREPVEDKTQSLDDADISYARVGALILLKVKPYREELWRHFVYNTLTQKVLRIDAIGMSCVQLPEDHGIIFPGGYYLQTGEHKTFEERTIGLKIKRVVRSPNGEDVLYVFYEPVNGVLVLLSYNMIEKSLKNPITCHGYALADDGTLVIFSAGDEPTRVHPMQIWTTPFFSAEFASKLPPSKTAFGKIGNSELVRGVSNLLSLTRLIENPEVSAKIYEELNLAAKKIFDEHYWVSDEALGDLAQVLKDVSATAELVIDEFEKVQSIQLQSSKALTDAKQTQVELLRAVRPDEWQSADQFVSMLTKLRRQRGHLVSISSYRYIDLKIIETLTKELESAEANLSERTLGFLADEKALQPYHEKIQGVQAAVDQAEVRAEVTPCIDNIDQAAAELDLLTELMSTLQGDDATVTTRIVDAISEVYGLLNQSRAIARNKYKSLGSTEATAQFGAQFKLFSQSINNALSLADTPEKCDEQLSRLLVQLEEFESQFSEYDQFLTEIIGKREEVYEAFEGHKQKLLDEQQQKAQSVVDAASRVLSSIEKRTLKFTDKDELNTYFASDALVQKVREFSERLRQLNSAVKADDVDARFKAVKEQALRSLRDKSDIFEAGGSVIKLGPRHRFSVNTQELDLTIIPRNNKLNIHLLGTDYYEPIDDAELNALSDYWQLNIESETEQVYRGEYLAYSLLEAARAGSEALSLGILQEALLDEAKLANLVKAFAAPRYKEGYEKGIHDSDATKILQALLPALDAADLLRFDPQCRALAQVFWASFVDVADDTRLSQSKVKQWQQRAQSAALLNTLFASGKAIALLEQEVHAAMSLWVEAQGVDSSGHNTERAAQYLVAELARDQFAFISSKYARALEAGLRSAMDDVVWARFQSVLENLDQRPGEKLRVISVWLDALTEHQKSDKARHFIPEAAAMLAAKNVRRRDTEADLQLIVEGLLGDHPLLDQGRLSLEIDSFLLRMAHHRRVVVAGYHQYHKVRQAIVERERKGLKLHEFKARPLSSFVRNRLINESYLPLIGDNLAKQMGTVGETKRTDLMGLLMMISPPGYGKTTLMEYVANRLGLIFMKINCPSLGHNVLSLDPEQAPNATARQELVKLNLGLEMGNNVMLYLDDIQHTDPEFLQKFISLCDGTRRIEGVWRKQTKTYDMRGKKFCVVMAGNPYTESGEAFKIPDMLANRADIYNLGDILGGMDEQFALSYIENSLTSNPVLAPLATREMADVYKLVKMAQGESIATTDLSHAYSSSEIGEITGVLKKMMVVRDVVLKINQQYIISAAQDDKYRTEPPFKLQGSYRNMNKMTEKISAVMNDAELMQMIADHYLGEAQLLTTGAEANLLKLAELRGNMTELQAERWQAIKKDFMRNKAMGGDDADAGGKIVAQLVDMVASVQSLREAMVTAQAKPRTEKSAREPLVLAILGIAKSLEKLAPKVEVINQPVPGIDRMLTALADTIENSIFPLVRSMDKKLEIDLKTHDKMQDVSHQLRALAAGNKRSLKKNDEHKE
ncbi:DNA repair ATPase [Simiduia curdlanivorans]|uniref:DNA repair ATPase n=1 Tax=Simiduia curdlanivorans TaxID=1492769 RepID=A0ABV8V0N2_9GAMM|nr:DNA repair ATPase [Simiduia curdlanivorans]MDN3637705.1 DNA repair ATPase [Simiduia curdlanivorans]